MSSQVIFLLLVFAAVVLLFQSFFVSVYSPQRANSKHIRKHLASLADNNEEAEAEILINKNIIKFKFKNKKPKLTVKENEIYSKINNGIKVDRKYKKKY